MASEVSPMRQPLSKIPEQEEMGEELSDVVVKSGRKYNPHFNLPDRTDMITDVFQEMRINGGSSSSSSSPSSLSTAPLSPSAASRAKMSLTPPPSRAPSPEVWSSTISGAGNRFPFSNEEIQFNRTGDKSKEEMAPKSSEQVQTSRTYVVEELRGEGEKEVLLDTEIVWHHNPLSQASGPDTTST